MRWVYKKATIARVAGVFVLAALLLGGIGYWLASRAYRPALLKARIEALLSDELESEVTIGSLEGRFFPRVALSGGGLVVRQRGRTDVPPLLTIEQFEIRASFRALMRTPRHVAEVRLHGMQVHIPPGGDRDDSSDAGQTDTSEGPDPLHDVVIDRFEAPDTVLTLIPGKPNKPPKVFTIHHLVMDGVGRGRVIPYIAVLTNPVPKGQIETSGKFGPWNVARPAQTPVAGKYVFANADLNTIEGLSGILSSEGEFDGPLNRIRVRGTTDTPKFQVDAGGQAVPLTTRFTALVDGSDGDTILENVDAQFLGTHVTAKGAVIGIEGVHGRQVEVEMHVDRGRVEDLLRLAMDSPKPILRGDVQFSGRLMLPPRKARVLDKMNLRGAFGLTQATFTDKEVQSKIVGLSRHGQGIKNGAPVGDVMSNLRGRFVIQNATAAFPMLTFGVPGAVVDLAGRYGLRDQQIDFHGHLTMDATISQAAGGGLKSFFLKAVDPFFKKDGAGAVLPIKITGNRKNPEFGLELFKKDKDQKKN
jgi:hypothetical protein